MKTARERFQEWLVGKKLTTAEAARRFGCSRTNLSLILNGHSRPGLDLAVAIERATARWRRGGSIRPAEWCEATSERKAA